MSFHLTPSFSPPKLLHGITPFDWLKNIIDSNTIQIVIKQNNDNQNKFQSFPILGNEIIKLQQIKEIKEFEIFGNQIHFSGNKQRSSLSLIPSNNYELNIYNSDKNSGINSAVVSQNQHKSKVDELNIYNSDKYRGINNTVVSQNQHKSKVDTKKRPILHLGSLLDSKDINQEHNLSNKKVKNNSSTIPLNTHNNKPNISFQTNKSDSANTYERQHFHGIEQFCRNAGGCVEGLAAFSNKINSSSSVIISIIWGNLDNNHVTTTVKYCTPSVPCSRWNCICDRNNRSVFISSQILGVLFLLPNELNNVYFLPLCSTATDTISNTSDTPFQQVIFDENKTVIQLNCNVNLIDRWSFLFEILSNAKLKKILFNSQLALMPIIYYWNSIQQNNKLSPSILLRNIIDPRTMAYLCNSDISEKELEFSNLLELYNISNDSTNNNMNNYSNLGFISKKFLQFKQELVELFHLSISLENKLIEFNLIPIYYNIELPVTILLSSMELRGINISLSQCNTLNQKILLKSKEIEQEIFLLANQTFNISSPEQVSNILFNILKIPQPSIQSKGRLSCCKPNLQQMPNQQKVADMDVNVKSLFKASQGFILVAADYSQIEMRILAHLCNDEELLKIFRLEGDVYRKLASLIMKKHVNDITEDERKLAKTVCLAKAKGHVKTLLGRIRFLPEINSSDQTKSATAQRQAVNSIIQGTASDIIKLAMIQVEKSLDKLWRQNDCNYLTHSENKDNTITHLLPTVPRPSLLMQIHDELIYEIPMNDPQLSLEYFETILRNAMESHIMTTLRLKVPLVANIKYGPSWGELIPIPEFQQK
eukprot:gene4801-6729_t